MAGRFSVEAVFKAVDRITAPVSRMQNRVGKFTRAMERGLRKVNRVLGKLTRGLAKGARSALKFGGASVVAGITAVTFALNRVADSADALAKQSRRLQFPIEELQEWKFVAEQSGVSTELLDKSFGAFTKRLGEAKGGIGPLVSGLKKINPQLLRQLTATTSVADAFAIYIDAIRNAKTATEKAALANAAFSRSGLELVNIADNSSDAIKALRKEQRENGVITLKQAEAAEAYNDAVNSLKRSLGGLLQDVLLPMLPTITKTVREWREWITVNKAAIKTGIVKFVEKLKQKFSDFIVTVREFNKEFNLVERFKEGVETLRRFTSFLERNGVTILKVTAAIVALSLILKTFAVVLGVVNLVMAANPIVLIVLGVLLLVAAFTALVVWIDGVVVGFEKMNPILRLVLAPLELIIRAIKFIKDNIGSILNPAGALREALFEDSENGKGKTGLTLKPAGSILGSAGSTLKSTLGSILDPFASIRETLLKDRVNGSAGGPQVVSPQERVARSIEEQRTTSTAEVTIKDETGRAEVTGGKLGAGLSLQSSGAF